MTKKALLIGCNYTNDSTHRLKGCIYDVYEMKKVLESVFGYTDTDIIMISDSNNDIEPTYSNILENLKKLVDISGSGDLEELFIHYSGHGTQVRDRDRDEPDGKDEGIVPIDYSNSGIITDDILYDNFFSKVDSKCRVVCVFDSCNSGSISDLDYSWLSDGKKIYKSQLSNRQLQPIEKKIFVLSGCVDDKYSYEAVDPETSHPCGALSLELRNVLTENNWILSIDTLIISLTKKLKTSSFTQTPVLTTGFDSEQTELVFINPKP
jgi:hypothetical protein